MLDDINKKLANWSFKEDDWVINLLFNEPCIRQQMFLLKDYSTQTINDIVLQAYHIIEKYRIELEENNKAFLTKKKYLEKRKNDKKIQITLNDEYTLKSLIDKYKIYELIGWVHFGRNIKVLKTCVQEKQKIVERLYPMIDESIRKVIGSKVIDPYSDDFEDAVNNAWMAIIKYLPKIDTSKVMFSIFIAIAHRSALNFNYLNLRHLYNVVQMSTLESKTDDDFDDDLFMNIVALNNADEDDIDFDVESFIIDSIDAEDSNGVINALTDNTIVDHFEQNNTELSEFQQNILTYSFNILSRRIKKLSFEKIYAEFFIDLINSKIPSKIVKKHATSILNIMNLVDMDENEHDKTMIKVCKLLKDWLKCKLESKLIMHNIDPKNKTSKSEYIQNLIGREMSMITFINKNKQEAFTSLCAYKNNCINFKI